MTVLFFFLRQWYTLLEVVIRLTYGMSSLSDNFLQLLLVLLQ